MAPLYELLRHEPRARRFLAAQAQSALGTGLGYVALLTIAYNRSHSAWAVTAILAAEFAPAALLGSAIGVFADRLPRRTLMVVADLLRVGAFSGLVVASSPMVIIPLALLAGVGNAAFNPSMLAAVPSMVSARRLAAATGLIAMIEELGYVLGPALAAGLLLAVGVRVLLLINAISFLISALVLARLDIGASSVRERAARDGHWGAELREGLSAVASDAQLRTLLGASAAFVMFLGAVNVAELLLVRHTLHGGAAGYALAVTMMGAGVSLGALWAGRSDGTARLRGGYLGGLAVCACGLLASGLAPVLAVAVLSFLIAGLGNGAAVTFERLILARLVPDRLRGRVFGLRSSLIASAIGVSYVLAGLLGSLVGPRLLSIIIGAGSLSAALLAWWALRRQPLLPAPAAEPPEPSEARLGAALAPGTSVAV
jgi:MFS family permease